MEKLLDICSSHFSNFLCNLTHSPKVPNHVSLSIFYDFHVSPPNVPINPQILMPCTKQPFRPLWSIIISTKLTCFIHVVMPHNSNL